MEEMSGVPFYSEALEWVWDRYSAANPTILDSVPTEFMSKSLLKKVAQKKAERNDSKEGVDSAPNTASSVVSPPETDEQSLAVEEEKEPSEESKQEHETNA